MLQCFNMVNPFPDLLVFSLLAPFILRIALGVYFVVYGWVLFQETHSDSANHPLFSSYGTALASVVGGLFVLAGFLTQIGAVILLFLSAVLAYSLADRRTVFLLLLFISLSLLVSGAGAFAFDLPL